MASDTTINASRSPQFESIARENSEGYHGEFSLPEHFHRLRSKTVVSFGHNDPENPLNWSQKKKVFVLLAGMLQVLNSTIGSSLPSGAIPEMAREFNVTSSTKLVLPISVFLIGYVVGPLLCGPLSESYGRKIPMLTAFILYNIFMMACALSTSFTAFLIFRLFNGMAAAAPIAIVGGLFADINDDPTARGRTMAWFMAGTTLGPVIGPWMSGFIAVVNWRWAFWLGLIIAGVTLPVVAFLPETYGPVILEKRARRLRKDTGDSKIVAPLELEDRSLRGIFAVTLTRPFRMVIGEPIVSLTCLYVSLAYAIFYLYFQAYPIVFQGVYGMSPGIAGLCYLPIGIGAFGSCALFLWYDGFLARAKARGAKWSQLEEYRRLPLACLAGPLYVVALFWLAWTVSPSIHWAVPMCSGFVFGIGYLLVFMAMLNYLSDAYLTFSASAQSAASCTRSCFGAVLPLAAKPMFDRLGVSWSCSLLAFLSLGVSIIPFAFIRYGERIRGSSKMCQELKRLMEEERRRYDKPTAPGSRDELNQGDQSNSGAGLTDGTNVGSETGVPESKRLSDGLLEKDLEKNEH